MITQMNPALGFSNVNAPERIAPLAPAAANPEEPTVVDQAKFVVNTVAQGRSMAVSKDVRSVGFNFAKLSLSHDTRKVGAAYIRAALQGNGKTINHLNHTNLVKRVGDQFEQLSRSKQVKKVGDGFTSFGRSVARQFNRLFG
ncbi:MAG: hypothetical protein U0835_24525 [Isosphaeraceae bacterium]